MVASPRLISVRQNSVQIGAGNPTSTPGITESGLFRGMNAMDAPLWFDGRNVIFRDGGPQKYPGWSLLVQFVTSGIIRGMDALQDGANISRLFFGDQTTLQMWDGTNLTRVGSGYVGRQNETSTLPSTVWSFARYGNFMVATEGVSPAQVWKGVGSQFVPLANTTFTTAEIVLQRGPHLVVFNTSNGSQEYEWSDADNPETWTPLTTNAAGNQQIRDMDGPIITAVNFSDQIAVFGKNEMYLVRYSGAPFYFPYTPAIQGIGAVSKCSVVQVNRMLFGMSRTGFWSSDGINYQYIDTPALRDYLTTQIDTANLSKVTVSYDSFQQMVIWSLPTSGTGENTFSTGYRVSNGSWHLFDFGRTAAVPQMGPFSFPLMSDSSGSIMQHNTGLSANGSAITSYIQSKAMDMGDDQQFKYVNRIMVQLRRLADVVRVRVGTQLNVTDAIAWSAYMTLDAGFSAIDYMAPGARFISLEVSSATTTADWAMSGFDLYGTVGGGL